MPREVMGNRDDLWDMLVGRVGEGEGEGYVRELVEELSVNERFLNE